eukprot:6591262-Prymnesium_polylepis.1
MNRLKIHEEGGRRVGSWCIVWLRIVARVHVRGGRQERGLRTRGGDTAATCLHLRRRGGVNARRVRLRLHPERVRLARLQPTDLGRRAARHLPRRGRASGLAALG